MHCCGELRRTGAGANAQIVSLEYHSPPAGHRRLRFCGLRSSYEYSRTSYSTSKFHGESPHGTSILVVLVVLHRSRYSTRSWYRYARYLMARMAAAQEGPREEAPG